MKKILITFFACFWTCLILAWLLPNVGNNIVDGGNRPSKSCCCPNVTSAHCECTDYGGRCRCNCNM